MDKATVAESYAELGIIMSRIANGSPIARTASQRLRKAIEGLTSAFDQAVAANPWFVKGFVQFSLKAWADSLMQEKVNRWLALYNDRPWHPPASIGVVMAGNIPMVGLHDYLCVMASGNQFIGKLSSEDDLMIPAVHRVLSELDDNFSGRARFTSSKLEGFDAVIATGSNNTSRYFEYYFGKYPHIIRRNRNGTAILDGTESLQDLELLGDDIFMYFGLGCRNVSKLYLPGDHDPDRLLNAWKRYGWIADHSKYRNNYDYHKSIFLVNGDDFYDNGFVLARKQAAFSSPVAVLHYETYDQLDDLKRSLDDERDHLQCIVSGRPDIHSSIPFGTSQLPELWEYADGVDTMQFLLGLNKPQ